MMSAFGLLLVLGFIGLILAGLWWVQHRQRRQIRRLITAMKMREARRLLETGDYRVNEVAFRLGFASPFYFSRRFRTFFGVSPSEYRQVAEGGG